MAGNQRHAQHIFPLQQARAQAVVHVVGVVGDFVCQIAQLRFQTGLCALQKPLPYAARLVLLQPLGVALRAVFEYAFARLKTQVKPVKSGVALL